MNQDIIEILSENYSEIAEKNNWKITPHGNGLINTSWRIASGDQEYFLQKVNTKIFVNIDALEANFSRAEKALHDTHVAIFPLRNNN